MKKVNILIAFVSLLFLSNTNQFLYSQVDNNCAFPNIVCGMSNTASYIT